MLTYVMCVKEEVSLFSVVKGEAENGEIISRLVWDCRKMNLRFRDPPWVPLGSPAALGLVELDEATLRGRHLGSFQGDVPDWFYILESEEELWPWFCLLGVEPQALYEYAKSRGIEIPPPPEGAQGVAAKVLPMGFMWAVFLAHSTLADIFNEAELESAAPWSIGRLSQASRTIWSCSSSTSTTLRALRWSIRSRRRTRSQRSRSRSRS